MLNRATRYAIQSLVIIARDSSGQPVTIASISSQLNISAKFLEAIVRDMRIAGFVKSHKGSAGGYTLSKAATEIKLAAIVRALNGPIALAPCVSLNFYEPCEICPDENACELHHVLAKVRDASLAIMEKTTVADLAGR
jgi:Rrf2 family protein